MLVGCVDGATKIGLDRLNWSQSLPSGEGVKFSGTAPTSTINKVYMDDGKFSVNGSELVASADIVISPVKGDYITDGTNDVVQFDTAWDELKAAGGGRIFIDEGTYTLGAGWFIDNSVNPVSWQIVGSGHSTKIIGPTDSDILMIKNGVMGIRKSSISNIWFSGPSSASPAHVGIDHNGTECETNLYNVMVSNCTEGINYVIPSSYNLRIDNILTKYCRTGFAIKGQNNVISGAITGYEPLSSPSYGIYVEGITHGNTLISCDGGSADVGMWLVGVGNTIINGWYDENSNTALLVDGTNSRVLGGFFPTGSIVNLTANAHYSVLDHIFSYNGRPTVTIASGVVGAQMIDSYWGDYSSKITNAGSYTGFSRPGLMVPSAPALGGIQGMVIWNSAAAGGGTPGWVCTTTGAEGAAVWKALPNLAA